jgi:hypothetical protein
VTTTATPMEISSVVFHGGTPTFCSGEEFKVFGNGLHQSSFVSFQEDRLECVERGFQKLVLRAPEITSHFAIGHLWLHRGEEEVRGPLIVVLARPVADTGG